MCSMTVCLLINIRSESATESLLILDARASVPEELCRQNPALALVHRKIAVLYYRQDETEVPMLRCSFPNPIRLNPEDFVD
jgi:hypothetical protein